MELISRAHARAYGLVRYFTGVPCINGHVSERATKSKKCLACHRERRAVIRKTQPELIKTQKAADYLKHREARLAAIKVYTTSEQGRAVRADYRARNSERIRAYCRKWMHEHRALMRTHERRRRDRDRAARDLEGSHTFHEVRKLFEAQAGLCANDMCNADLTVTGHHEDHIRAIALGGSDRIDNIQLLCPACNLRKGRLSPEDWETKRHFVSDSSTLETL